MLELLSKSFLVLVLMSATQANNTSISKLEPRDSFQFSPRYDTLGTSTRYYPGVAMITYRTYELKCSGSLLSYQWVLTAAQCFHYRNENFYWVCAGYDSFDQFTANFSSEANCREPYSIHQHSKYGGCCGYDEDDIALVEVKRPFLKSDRVKPIQLSASPLEPGRIHECFVVGYCNPLLRERPVTVSRRCFCHLQKPGWKKSKDIRAPFMCYNRDDRPKATRVFCNGDQGAGLLCNNHVFGILSATLNSSFYNTCLKQSSVFINGTGFGEPAPRRTVAFINTCIHIKWINRWVKLFSPEEIRAGGCGREEELFDKIRDRRKDKEIKYWGEGQESRSDKGSAMTQNNLIGAYITVISFIKTYLFF